jgi:hypothetical protein
MLEQQNLTVQISKQLMNNIRTDLNDIIIELEITFLKLQKLNRNLLKDVHTKEIYKKLINYTDGTLTRLIDNQTLFDHLIVSIDELN